MENSKWDNEHIIYSISIEDLRVVAKVRYGVDLNDDELRLLDEKVGDYFEWVEPIAFAINNELGYEELDDYEEEYY